MRKLLIFTYVVLVPALLFAQSQGSAKPSAKSASPQASERLSADTPKTTVLGNAFVAPKDWSIRVQGPATILEAPEGDSWIAIIDVQGATPEEALAAAWKVYKPDAKWPVKVSHELPDKDGWSRRHSYEYLTSPNEKRSVGAQIYYAGSNWTVVIENITDAVAEKRAGQEELVLGRLLPKGYTRESFAGGRQTLLTSAGLLNSVDSSNKAKRKPGFPALPSVSSRTARSSSRTVSESRSLAAPISLTATPCS